MNYEKFYGITLYFKVERYLRSDKPNVAKNADVYAELIQVLDNRSLSLFMRDTKDMSSGKPKVIALYTELTTLCEGEAEKVTDYMLRAEWAVAALRDAEEEFSDALLMAMIVKGLPSEFKALIT